MSRQFSFHGAPTEEYAGWDTLNAADLGAGVADTTTFLRGDLTWAVPSGGPGGGFTLTAVEIDLGSIPSRGGSFDIAGLSGLTAGKQTLVVQAAGPYTGKGTLADEAEMDQVQATGYVVDANTIRCYWTCATFVKGNLKFGYAVSA